MALLRGDELELVVKELDRRGAHVFHACQLKDLRAYLALGGIPSRETVETSGRPYTPFDTDTTDRQNGTWGKVFGNLSDFGFGFARAEWRRENTAPVPNPYGPVLLEFRPRILLEAEDVAICLRSAGGQEFRRELETLATAEEVGRLFTNEFDPNGGYANTYIKYSDELRQTFKDRVKPAATPGWSTLNPEISCTAQGGKLSFSQLCRVIVDGYCIEETSLLDFVTRDFREAGVPARVQLRVYRQGAGRERILEDISRSLLNGPCGINKFLTLQDISEQSLDWGRRVLSGRLGWIFDRFSSYLRSGTLLEMSKGTSANLPPHF